MNEHRIGDIVNGHILTETGWVPVDAPTPVAAPVAKKGKGKKIAVITGAVLFGLVACSAAIGSETADTVDETSVSASEEPTVEETEEVEEVKEETAPGIGDKVRDGKFEFVVTDVRSGLSTYGDGFLAEEAQGEFTVVKVKVENIGDEAQTFFASNSTGIDSKDRSLDAETILDDSILEDINPGNSIKATVVFDVAKGETLDAVVLHDSAFSGGATVILS